MNGPEASAVEDVEGIPRLADALPAAEHSCTRAVAHVEGRRARGDLLEALVALLEAAGGQDVGNAVRTHVERAATPAPARCATDRPRVRVLLAAVRLQAAAERDLRDRLQRTGLDGRAGSGGDGDAPSSGPAARARHAERVLRARRSAVDRVVAALGGGDLLTTADGSWADALVLDLPPDLSQGETDSGAAPR